MRRAAPARSTASLLDSSAYSPTRVRRSRFGISGLSNLHQVGAHRRAFTPADMEVRWQQQAGPTKGFRQHKPGNFHAFVSITQNDGTRCRHHHCPSRRRFRASQRFPNPLLAANCACSECANERHLSCTSTCRAR